MKPRVATGMYSAADAKKAENGQMVAPCHGFCRITSFAVTSLAKKNKNAKTDVDAVTHQILNTHGSFRPAHNA